MNAPAYRVDGQPVEPASFYAAACDPARSVVVEACAGAGKTWMLVSRILRALVDGVPPQQILAITFTRKAAGEMRARLEQWLAAFGDGACTAAERESELIARGCRPAFARAAAPRLGALRAQLLAEGRAVEVRTFHGWFGLLLSHAPLSLLRQIGLPPAYELIEDTSVLTAALLRRFQRVVQADPELRGLYVGLVQRHRRSVVADWLAAMQSKSVQLLRADAAGTLADAVPSAGALWPECAGLDEPASRLGQEPLRSDLAALAVELGAASGSTRQTAAAGLVSAIEALQSGAALPAFEYAWAALFTDKNLPRQRMGESALRERVVEALQLVRSQRQQEQAHQDHRALVRLGRVLLAEYAALKQRRSLVDMADLEHAASKLLDDPEAAGWVQQRLDLQVRHLLIDEFQDTSPLQWQALAGWLASYAGAGGGASGQQPPALFIVGDPKQSIYRFRNADPRVFEAAREFVQQSFDGLHLQCDHTRRNAPAVLAAVNGVFSSPALVDWGPFRVHTSASLEEGGVRVLAPVPRAPRSRAGDQGAEDPPPRWRDSLTEARHEPEQQLRAEEAQRVAAAVAALLSEQGLAPGQVLVLARRRSTLTLVAAALAAAGVPHALAEPLQLNNSAEALDLIALLDVLASPGHDLALARALKSPLFDATDEDLLWLSRRRAATGLNWLPALLQAEDAASPALARARSLLPPWMRAVRELPPHDAIDRIMHEGDVLARMAAAVPPSERDSALQALQAVGAAALEHDGGRNASVYTFVRELRAGRVRAHASIAADAVALRTVHGAKGLEAEAVVIADCHGRQKPREKPGLLLDWPVQAQAPRRAAFIRSGSALAPSLASLWQEEQAALAREDLNALYVAMTRARRWLVLGGIEPMGAVHDTTWWEHVQAYASPWQPAPVPPRDRDAAASVRRLPALQRASAVPAAMPQHSASGARLGEALHRVLEWLGHPGAAREPGERAGHCEQAARAFGLAPEAGRALQRSVDAVLDSPSCAPFFYGPGLRWSGNEVVLAFEGQSLRIDRLVLLEPPSGEAAWWVLDYKLEGDPEARPEYDAQLRRYAAAVQASEPDSPVRAAFITASGRLAEIPLA